MYDILKEVENILNIKDITGYKIEINTEDKNYVVDKPEQEKHNTNAIGFEIPNKIEED